MIEEIKVTRYRVADREFDSREKAEGYLKHEEIRKAVSEFVDGLHLSNETAVNILNITLTPVSIDGSLERFAMQLAKIRASIYPERAKTNE